MTALGEFAEQLADELCAVNALEPEPARREQLILELASQAENFLNRRVIEAMTEDSAARFEQLIEEPTVTSAITQAFVAANVPDLEGVVRRALIEFRHLYLRDG